MMTNPDGHLKSSYRPRVDPPADFDVVIVGAGPYGLSAGVHLQAKGFGVRVFGEPMDFWANRMPEGMLLRSPREASNIADPNSILTLEAYEAATGTEPRMLLPRETFVRYGHWFQQHLGTSLDRNSVREIRRDNGIFRATLQDGTLVRSRRVVVAAGIGPFQRRPDVFADLPSGLVSHCYEGRKISDFVGRRVAIIGAGQSALESAALLHEAGADVVVIAAIPTLRWVGMHSWLHHLGPISTMLYSRHDVGPVGISRLVAYPRLVSLVPLPLRDKIRTRAVRPAGARWLRERVNPVKIRAGCKVQSAKAIGNEAQLQLDDGSDLRVDHVLMGTGYEVDIARYDFLSPSLLAEVQRYQGYPRLTRGLRSSVPGLHFVGATAARSYGPLLYFVAGTEFASRELTAYVARSGSRDE